MKDCKDGILLETKNKEDKYAGQTATLHIASQEVVLTTCYNCIVTIAMQNSDRM